MLRKIARVLLASLLVFGGVATAQDRASCNLLKSIDLKPLLGADHDAPVPFGKESCRAESKGPGGIVILGIQEGTPAEIKNMFEMVKKINTTHRAKEVKVVAEPSLGPEAFSVRENDMRQIEIFASRGKRMVTVQGGIGKPLGDAGVKQFVGVAKAALDKLQ